MSIDYKTELYIPVKQIKYLLAVLIACNFNLHANDMIIRQISLAEQLPSNTAYRIFQDRDGFVWIGTPDGFCRYDGYAMKSFRSEITRPVFPSNFITGGFAEDTLNHVLWIGSEKGVLILDKYTGMITQLDSGLLGKTPVRQILYDAGIMWVCSESGLYLYDTSGTLKKKYLNGANSIHIDSRGTVRVTVWHGGMYYLDKATDTFIPYPRIGRNNNPHKIFQDAAGRFWVCTWGDGLYRFYPDKRNAEMYERIDRPDDKSFDFGIFFDIEQDDINGCLWALSYAGVCVFMPEDGRITPVDEFALPINSETNIFSDIMKDRDGNLWFGTYEQGAIVVSTDRSAITNFPLQFIKTQTGHTSDVRAVFEDRDGELWLRQSRLGIYLFNPETAETRESDIFEARLAISICNCSAQNEIWVTTEYESNIFRLRKSNGKITL
jgi:ligand-binding sensor domain-containing protein